MARAVIALGSNLGDRAAALRAACEAIAALPGTRLLAQARTRETEPVDVPSAYASLRFLNSAALIETALSPEDLLSALNRIEAEAGRIRTERNAPRPIDLDLILYEGERRQSERLTLPHPRAHLRDFVLKPLADLGLSAQDILANRLSAPAAKQGRVKPLLLALALTVGALAALWILGLQRGRAPRPPEAQTPLPQAAAAAAPEVAAATPAPAQTPAQPEPEPGIDQAAATAILRHCLARMTPDSPPCPVRMRFATAEAAARFAQILPPDLPCRTLRDPDILALSLPRARLAHLLDHPPEGLIALEAEPLARLCNKVAIGERFLGGSTLRANAGFSGLTGRGTIVAVIDTGISSGLASTLHADLLPPLYGMVVEPSVANAANLTPQDLNGHGTHVAGSVVSQGTQSAETSGAAPEASLFFQRIGGSTAKSLALCSYDSDHFARSVRVGANIISCSWERYSGDGSLGYYAGLTQDIDRFVWNNPETLLCFAIGNEGFDNDGDGVIDANSVYSWEAYAKNVLTVGAQESYRPTLTTQGDAYKEAGAPISSDKCAAPYADGLDGMAAFSSRGPLRDGRIAPMLVAPGTFIYSTSYSGNATALMSGSSMATPLASGTAALLHQYLREAWQIERPTAALMRAGLILCTETLAPGQYGIGATREIPEASPNAVEGWGALHLGRHLAGGQTFGFTDRIRLTCAGAQQQIEIPEVEAGGELVAVLSWVDYPGIYTSATTTAALCNDYDLSLTAPDGTVTTLDDHLNPIERLRIPVTQSGTYTLTITLTKLTRDGSGNLAAVAWRANTAQGAAPMLPEVETHATERVTLTVVQPEGYAPYVDFPLSPAPGTYSLPKGTVLPVHAGPRLATSTSAADTTLCGWTLKRGSRPITRGAESHFTLTLEADTTLRWFTLFPTSRFFLR